MTIKVESTSLPVEAPKVEEPKVEAQVEKEDAPASSEAEDETTEESGESEETEDKAEDETEKEEAEGEPEKLEPKKPLKGFKKRIDRLSKNLSTERQEKEYWKNEAMRLKAPESKQEEREPSGVKDDGKPSADNYETHEEYVEALADWKFDQRLKDEKAKEQTSKVQTERQKLIEDYNQKTESFKKEHDDFEDVVASIDEAGIKIPVVLEHLLLKSGPQVTYALFSDAEECERISKLYPMDMAEEIGRIKASLQSKKEEPKKQTTKAPAPITPVGAKGTVSTKSIFDPDISQSDYEALRAKQLAKKRA